MNCSKSSSYRDNFPRSFGFVAPGFQVQNVQVIEATGTIETTKDIEVPANGTVAIPSMFSSDDEWLEDVYQFLPIQLPPYNHARYARYTISINFTNPSNTNPTLPKTNL